MIKYKKSMREEEEWETCSAKIYNLLLIHCPPYLEEVLKTMTNWDLVSASDNSMGLLVMIRDVSHDKTGEKQTVMTFFELTIELFTFFQQVGMSNDEYAIMFKAYVEALTAHGGTPWHYPALMQKHWDLLLAARMLVETQISADCDVKVAKELEAEARKIADDEFLACLFIRMADSKRYWELNLKLSNTFVFGGGLLPEEPHRGSRPAQELQAIKEDRQKRQRNNRGRARNGTAHRICACPGRSAQEETAVRPVEC